MATPLRQVQPALAFAARHLDEDLSLHALADRAGLSPCHLHRVFAGAAGETPRQFTSRLRLGRAAALLLSGREPVLDIALACGFQSHEVFCRAFRRCFGMSPSAYRERGFTTAVDAAQSRLHAALVDSIGPCVGLYHTNENQRSGMTYSITTKEITAHPVLLVRRRVKRSEIAKMIGESLPLVFMHAQKTGAALAGVPFARYLDWGPGMITMEAGMQVSSPGALGEGDVLADMLPGGLVAATMHEGLYDTLSDAHGAIQQWVEEHGFKPAGAPWESYVTDPGECPDPKDWQTEVIWPLAP
jgi:AraC family transcriptional regulator